MNGLVWAEVPCRGAGEGPARSVIGSMFCLPAFVLVKGTVPYFPQAFHGS